MASIVNDYILISVFGKDRQWDAAEVEAFELSGVSRNEI